MTDTDKARFAAVMSSLGLAFDSEPSKQKMAIYFDALMDFPIEAIEFGAKGCIANLKFFPKAAEIREYAHMAPATAREKDARISRENDVKLLEELTPPDVARKNLAELAARLNSGYGTTLVIDESLGHPRIKSARSDSRDKQ